MKTAACIFFIVVWSIISSFGQKVQEDDFRKNGSTWKATAYCKGEPMFKIEVTSAFKKNQYTSLRLIVDKPYFVGFKVIEKPDQMTPEADFRNKKFNWTPTEDFREV